MNLSIVSAVSPFLYWLGHLVFRELARGLFDHRVLGRENIQFPGPAIIICNHVSFLDPPFVGIAFDEVISILARKTLFRNPAAGWLLRQWDAVPVDQEKPDPGSLKSLIRLLRSGRKVLIFPEGSRSEDGRLARAEAGVGFIMAKAGVPVVPARIFGAYEALPRHSRFPRPSKITVVFGKPWLINLSAYPETGKELYQKLADEAMASIGELVL